MSIINEKFLTELSRYSEVSVINEKYVGVLKKNKTIIICSSMGSGKTYSIVHLLKEIGEEQILFLMTRITLTHSSIRRYNENGIEIANYQNVVLDINLYNKLAVQIESLHKLNRNYKVVVIDEFSSMVNQLFSPHHGKNYQANINSFETIVSQCDYLILSCADLNYEQVHKFLNTYRKRDIRNKNISITHNSFQHRENYHCYGYNSIVDFTENLLNSLKENKRVVLVSGSKMYLTVLGNNIIDQKLLLLEDMKIYTGDTDDVKKKEDLKDVEKSWNVKFLGYTSTILCGVDYTTEHYDVLFMYCDNQTINSREIIQMSARVRNIKERTIHCFINNTFYDDDLPEDKENIKMLMSSKIFIKNLYMNTLQFKLHQSIKPILETPEEYSTEQRFPEIDFDTFINFALIEVAFEKNRNVNNFKRELLNHFTRLKITYEFDDNHEDDIDEKTSIHVCIVGKKLNAISEDLVFKSKLLSDEEYKELKLKPSKTTDEKYQIRKYDILSVYKPENREKILKDRVDYDLTKDNFVQIFRYRKFISTSKEQRLMNARYKISMDHQEKVFDYDKGKFIDYSSEFEFILEYFNCKDRDIFDKIIYPKEILNLSKILNYEFYVKKLGYQGKEIDFDDDTESKIITKTLGMLNSIFYNFIGCKFKRIYRKKDIKLNRPDFFDLIQYMKN